MEQKKALFPLSEQVRYSSAAIRSVVTLSAHSLHDRHLPDKAIDVIDEAALQRNLSPIPRRKKTIQVTDIEHTVAQIARIPEYALSHNKRKLLELLESTLHRAIFGQDKAIVRLTAVLKRSRAGLGEKTTSYRRTFTCRTNRDRRKCSNTTVSTSATGETVAF